MPERHAAEPGGSEAARPAVRIADAAWLGPSALLLVGRLGADGEAASARVREGSQSRAASARTRPLDGETLVIVCAAGLERTLAGGGDLELTANDGSASLANAALGAVTTDLRDVVRSHLAPLDAAARAEIIEFLAQATADAPRLEAPSLAERLHLVRDALREALPPAATSESRPEGLELEHVLAVDDRSFYLVGWLHDPNGTVTRVTAVSPEGARVQILERMYRYPRLDVARRLPADTRGRSPKHGFLCFVELRAPSVLSEGWLLEMETLHGDAVEVAGSPVTRDESAVRDAILREPQQQRVPDDELMTHHVYPAISRIQGRMSEPRIERVIEFGAPPDAPDVSIVVPIYKRLEHLEMQLAEFVRDPEIAEADLVYVLDSPEQAEDFLDRAAQLMPLYKVPFRVVLLEQNVGYAGANNAGASVAKGRLLLLLNSDILPDRPGWLSRMREFHDATDRIGALGAKLLYEDDTIQHAGMYFHQPPGTGVWQDAHYFKGMHRSLPAANVARSVPLVSGACLMIDRALYEELSGLRGIFVRGDYEDSDLCLRLIESGRENWYVPDVELYHLEAQSYVESERYAANRYNMWVHSHLWGRRIAEIMREPAGAGPRRGLAGLDKRGT